MELSDQAPPDTQPYHSRWFARLAELTACPAPSGLEHALAEHIRAQLPSAAVRQDAIGNLAVRLGPRSTPRKLLVLAHMDEVGLVVSAIAPTGWVHAVPLGMVDPAVLSACTLQVLTRDGPRQAIASAPPAHLADLAHAATLRGGVWLDVGATSQAEVHTLGITPGDPVCYTAPLTRLGGTRIGGKSLDNRIGCALLLELALTVAPEGDWSVVLGFTVQEEIGARGAEVLVRAERPTAVIVVDTVTATDPYYVPEPMATQRVGGGPAVRALDLFSPGGPIATRGVVYSQRLRRLAGEVAADRGLAIQHDVARTWTDGGQACSSNDNGVPTLGVYVARRGSHSPAEVADLEDVANTALLLEALVRVITTNGAGDLSTPW